MEMQRRLNEIELENVFGGEDVVLEKPKYTNGEIVVLKSGIIADVYGPVRRKPNGEVVYSVGARVHLKLPFFIKNLTFVPLEKFHAPQQVEISQSEIDYSLGHSTQF